MTDGLAMLASAEQWLVESERWGYALHLRAHQFVPLLRSDTHTSQRRAWAPTVATALPSAPPPRPLRRILHEHFETQGIDEARRR